MMLGRVPKKTNKFQDSDTHMSRPRAAVSEPPNRPTPRVPPRQKATAPTAVGSAASGAHRPAIIGVGRGTPPRSPLHEKKAAGASGPRDRVAELEVKLGKAHDLLTEMRGQVADAEKARKDARGVLVEAKKPFAAKKKDVTTPAPVEDDHNNVSAETKQHALVVAVAADVTNGVDERRNMDSPETDVLQPILIMTTENKEARAEDAKKRTTDDFSEEMNSVAIVASDDHDGKKGNPETEQLKSKLAAKDREAYELRAQLMVKDGDLDDLRTKLAAKDADVHELTAKLIAKDGEIADLEADLTQMAEEASEAAKESRAKARDMEQALRESAVREARLAERLRASESARAALETEMQRSRVQSEQWRKAAEEAAVVLGGTYGGADRGAGERGAAAGNDSMRVSWTGTNGDAGVGMEKQSTDDEGSAGKRKSGGAMRVFSDLWKKKKGHK